MAPTPNRAKLICDYAQIALMISEELQATQRSLTSLWKGQAIAEVARQLVTVLCRTVEGYWHDASSVLKLHSDLVCAPFDLWLARIAGGDTERDVHFYVGDRYWRLAEHYESLSWIKTAKRFRLQAEHHLRLSGWNDTPPAVAVAMEVPRPLTFIKAIGRRLRRTLPDDAA